MPALTTYKHGIKYVTPEPLTGDGGQALNDNFKQIAELLGNVVSVTAAYTVLATDSLILADSTTAAFTITLPTAVGIAGRRYRFKRIGTSNNNVTLDGNAAETIDGAITYVMRGRDESVEIVSDGANWRKITNYEGTVPVGAVIAYLKSFLNTPALPSGYVECNGQTLADVGSVYNTQVIPNLNGSAGTKRFLRGSTTSGTVGGTETHSHTLSAVAAEAFVTVSVSVADPFTMGTAGTLPSYYEVVYVLRIK